MQAKWRAIDTGVAGERLVLWHDGTHILAVELEAPRVAEGWDALRHTIGNPDAKLGYWDGVVEAAAGQWVYATRGLALYTTLADTELARAIAFPDERRRVSRQARARDRTAPRSRVTRSPRQGHGICCLDRRGGRITLASRQSEQEDGQGKPHWVVWPWYLRWYRVPLLKSEYHEYRPPPRWIVHVL